MLRSTKLVCSLSIAAMFVGCQSTEDLGGKSSPNASMMDNHFFKNAAISNMTEIQMSQDALSRTSNQHIREFAQRMIDDHTNATNQLQQLASTKGAMLPTKLDSTHQEMVDALRNESGADFDRDYVKDQVMAHEEAISDTQKEADNGSDPDAKALAQQLLPTLQHHLGMAKDLQSSM